MKALASLADRILSIVLPRTAVSANDYCWYNMACQKCNDGRRRVLRQLCCTTQDGRYCLTPDSYGCGTC